MLIRENIYRWCRPHSSSYSVPQIIVGRLSLGVGVVGASVIAPLYITELVAAAVRRRCLGTKCAFPFEIRNLAHLS